MPRRAPRRSLRTRRGAALFYGSGCGSQPKRLAGEGGFEPPNGGSKGRCLTTWRLPKTVGFNAARIIAIPRGGGNGRTLCGPTARSTGPGDPGERPHAVRPYGPIDGAARSWGTAARCAALRYDRRHREYRGNGRTLCGPTARSASSRVSGERPHAVRPYGTIGVTASIGGTARTPCGPTLPPDYFSLPTSAPPR